MQPEAGRSAHRTASIDAWRFIAIVAVVLIHATPTSVAALPLDRLWREPSIYVNQVARFAVPFFFVMSGYLWGRKVRSGAPPIATTVAAVRRLLLLFVVGSAIYVLPYDVASLYEEGVVAWVKSAWWHLNFLALHPYVLAMEGTRSHLWFIVALMFANIIAAALLRTGLPSLLLPIAVLLYIAALVTKPYATTPFGIPVSINTRDGPFVGTLFFASGYLLSACRPDARWMAWGLILFVCGCGLHLSEVHWLSTRFGADPFQDFVLGTVPMGVGVAMMAISGRELPGFGSMAAAGRVALGIYLIHFVFIELTRFPEQWMQPWLAQLVGAAIVVAMSLPVARWLFRNRYARTVFR